VRPSSVGWIKGSTTVPRENSLPTAITMHSSGNALKTFTWMRPQRKCIRQICDEAEVNLGTVTNGYNFVRITVYKGRSVQAHSTFSSGSQHYGFDPYSWHKFMRHFTLISQHVAMGDISNVSEVHIVSIFTIETCKDSFYLYLRPCLEKTGGGGRGAELCSARPHHVLEWGHAREAHWPLKGPVL
jgi:hypothetical protein